MSFGKLGALGRAFGRLGGGSGSTGGPFLLKVDAASRILLSNGTDSLLITGATPAAGAGGQPLGLLLILTDP